MNLTLVIEVDHTVMICSAELCNLHHQSKTMCHVLTEKEKIEAKVKAFF